jgi:hypothetical protein
MPSQPRPLFVFGCPRSGTSLLGRLLGAHPNIAIPYESHLYDAVFPFVGRTAELEGERPSTRLLSEILRTEHIKMWRPQPSLAQTMEAITRPGFHGIVEALLRAWAQGQGKARWGEKTPQHTLHWRTILEGFPDLQAIHLVRDGRDVALSYKAVFFGPKHVYPLAGRWIRYLKAAAGARAALGDDGFLTVRYEDLVGEPESELRRICDFVGEQFTPAMLTFYREDVAARADRHNAENLRSPILSHNVGKWRTQMTARELRIFEALAGDALEQYGYPRAQQDARISTWEALSCRYLEGPPRRVLAMVRNRQGQRLALQSLRLRLAFGLGL